MSGFRDVLKCFGAALSDMALCLLVLSLRPIFPPEGCHVFFPVGIWVIILGVQVLVNRLMMGKGAPVNLYLLWNLVVIGCLLYVAVRGTYELVDGKLLVNGSRDLKVLTALGAVVTGAHGALAAWSLPGANGLLRYVDILTVSVGFYLWAATQMTPGNAEGIVLLAVAAIVMDLAAVNQIRTREEGETVIRGAGTGGKLALLAIAVCIAAVAGLCVGAASGQIHSLVDVILVILKYVGLAISAVLQVFTFVVGGLVVILMLLMPGGSPMVQERMENHVKEQFEEMTGGFQFQPPEWFWPVAGLTALLAVVVFVMLRFRGIRLKPIKKRHPAKTVIRKNHAWEALKAFILRVVARIRFEIRYLQYRDTPSGLLMFVQRLYGKRHLKRDRTESPGAYMRRLASMGNSQGKEILESLAQVMDQSYYGEGERISRERCREYRKALKEYFENQNNRVSLPTKG